MTDTPLPLREVLRGLDIDIDAAIASILASAEVAALQQRVAALEAALRNAHDPHDEGCASWPSYDRPCDCGVEALLPNPYDMVIGAALVGVVEGIAAMTDDLASEPAP